MHQAKRLDALIIAPYTADGCGIDCASTVTIDAEHRRGRRLRTRFANGTAQAFDVLQRESFDEIILVDYLQLEGDVTSLWAKVEHHRLFEKAKLVFAYGSASSWYIRSPYRLPGVTRWPSTMEGLQ